MGFSLAITLRLIRNKIFLLEWPGPFLLVWQLLSLLALSHHVPIPFFQKLCPCVTRALVQPNALFCIPNKEHRIPAVGTLLQTMSCHHPLLHFVESLVEKYHFFLHFQIII